MKIKVNRPHLNLKPFREAIIWIVFFVVVAAGAFGWGVIYEFRRNSDLKIEFAKQKQNIRDVDGRLTALENRTPRGMHGSAEKK